MYGCLLTPPVVAGSHLGVLFLHNEGYSSMCGHGVIALTTAVFERGLMGIPRDLAVLRLDTPAGLVEAVPLGRAKRSPPFSQRPVFVYALDHRVEVPGIGAVACDVAFGGAFYAFCRAEDLGVRLVPEDFRKLIDLGMKVKRAVMDSLPIRHPFEEDLSFLYGTIIMGPAGTPGHFGRNVCIFADGEVDRSPTGTGVSARAALHVAKGQLGLGEPRRRKHPGNDLHGPGHAPARLRGLRGGGPRGDGERPPHGGVRVWIDRPTPGKEDGMGGFFGVVGQSDSVEDLFYGTDYHSHLGTKRGGLAVGNGDGHRPLHPRHHQRPVPLQVRATTSASCSGTRGIGVISDYEDQPLIIGSHLGTYAIVTVGVVENVDELVAPRPSRQAPRISPR